MSVAILAPACRGFTPASTDGYQTLIRSAANVRLLDARLPGGFRHASPRARAATTGGDPLPPVTPQVRLAVASLERRARASPDPRLQMQAAVGKLLEGRPADALRDLTDEIVAAVGVDGLVARSAAYMARAAAEGSVLDAAAALDAALEAASLDPRRPEAWFNAALAARALHLPHMAADAWRRSAEVDLDPAWRYEARQRAAETRVETDRASRLEEARGEWAGRGQFSDDLLRADPDIVREVFERAIVPQWIDECARRGSPASVRTTGDVVALATRLSAVTGDRQPVDLVQALTAACAAGRRRCSETAAAYRTYVAGREKWDRRLRDAAWADLESSFPGLRAADLPEAGWVQIHLALRDYYAGRMDQAAQRCGTLLAWSTRREYVALSGRTAWLLGLLAHEQGRFGKATEAYAQALALFTRAGDRESLGAIHNLLADYYRLLEDFEQAWTHQTAAFATLPLSGSIRRGAYFGGAAALAADAGLRHAANAFLDLATQEARAHGTPDAVAMALGEQARGLAGVGRYEHAEVVLAEARRLVEGTEDASVAAIVTATLDLELARLRQATRPRDAVGPFGKAIDFYARHGSALVLPGLFLQRGDALARSGQHAEAEADWQEGLSVARQQRSLTAHEDERLALHAARWGLYAALADVEFSRRHNPARALEILDEGRALTLLERVGLRSTAFNIARQAPLLPESTLVLVFATLRGHTVLWALSRDAFEAVRIDRSADGLAADVERFREAARGGANAGAFRNLSGLMFGALLGRVADRVRRARRLVVVPDGALHQVPFAALFDERAGNFLVERASIVVAPSLGYALNGNGHDRLSSRPRVRALLVANPRPGNGEPALPGSLVEIAALGRIYPDAVVVSGADATPLRFVREAERADVVHFAGHAVSGGARPLWSRLLLAPDADYPDGALRAADLRNLRLRGCRVVVLSACETASGAIVRGEGVVGLVSAFLGSGARAVVATLWPLDDRAAPGFFAEFHEAWRRSGDPAEALREAQVTQLRMPGARPAVWAAPVVVGPVDRVPRSRE